MGLTRKRKIIKYGVYSLLIIAAALLQNVAGLFPQVGSARCFLIIPTCVLLGINEDERTAAFFGLFGGLLWDMVSVQHMGFNCIYLMLFCYIASALESYIFRNTFLSGLLSACGVTVIYCILYWLFFVLLSSPEGAGKALGRFYLPCAVYTMLITPLAEAALIPIKSRLSGERQLDY